MSLKSPLVSIIVPMYNAEGFLARSLDSLLSQTYQEIEVVAVNDSSSDGTLNLLEQYSQRDSRVTIITVPQQGSAKARQAGIKKSSGDYIGFLDSDDWAEPEFIESLISSLVQEDVDIASCGYLFEYEGSSRATKPWGCDHAVRHEGEAVLRGFYEQDGTSDVTMWNKIYKRNMFRDVEFPSGVAPGEDFCVMTQILRNAESLYYVGRAYIHYAQRMNTIAHKVGYDKKQLAAIRYFLKLETEMCLEHPTIAPAIRSFTIDKMVYAALPMFRAGELNQELLDTVRNHINEHYKEYRSNPYSDKRFRRAGVMIAKSPRLFAAAYSVWIKTLW